MLQERKETLAERSARFHKEFLEKLDKFIELIDKHREALRLHMDTRKNPKNL